MRDVGASFGRLKALVGKRVAKKTEEKEKPTGKHEVEFFWTQVYKRTESNEYQKRTFQLAG